MVTTNTSSAAANPWIIRAAGPPAPSLKLYCIPHAGGNAALFRTWRKALPPEVEICSIQLPGRLSHFRTAAFTRMDPLADALAEVVSGDAGESPYAIFGHCTGALLAYEVAQRMSERGRPPQRLFVACSRPPHLPDRDPPVRDLPEEQLVEALRAMGGTPPQLLSSPPMLRLLLPTLRADFEVAETYAYRPRPPLACAATVFGAEGDPMPRSELQGWGDRFTTPVEVEIYPGGHFLLDTSEVQVLASIARALAGPPDRRLGLHVPFMSAPSSG